jgi:hypothetical protein
MALLFLWMTGWVRLCVFLHTAGIDAEHGVKRAEADKRGSEEDTACCEKHHSQCAAYCACEEQYGEDDREDDAHGAVEGSHVLFHFLLGLCVVVEVFIFRQMNPTNTVHGETKVETITRNIG